MENNDFEFISVSFSAVTVGYIRYQHTISLNSYDLNIESFRFPWKMCLHKTLQYKKNTFLGFIICGRPTLALNSALVPQTLSCSVCVEYS